MAGKATTEPWVGDFAGNLVDLVEKFDDLDADEVIGDALDEQAAIAGGERSLGDTQQGREILELLQNGRDAIHAARSGTERDGLIYIGVSDNGVTVANTGAGFDFRKEKVRNAARITGASAKSQNQIGKYGVGLTSIRSVGEAYEVLTRLNPDTEEDPVRVRFSPAAPVAAAHAAVKKVDTESLRDFRNGLIDADTLKENLNPEINEIDASIDADSKRRIQDLPLFFYPVVLQSEAPDRTDPHLSRRASQLLNGNHPGFDSLDGSRRFSTAVTVDFEDYQWRNLLSELDIDPTHTVAGSTEIDRPSPSQRAEQTWQYISYDADENTGLSPETVVHLGGIKQLYLERFKNGEVVEQQPWKIEEEALGFEETDRFDASIVTVTISSTSDDGAPVSVSDQLKFQSFEWTSDVAPKRSDHEGLAEDQRESKPDEDNRIHPRILVPQPGQEAEYAPHLYYPISGVDVRFPFCLHGEFLLETSRQNLHQDCIRHNATLLSLCSELLAEVAEAVAVEPDLVRWKNTDNGDRSPTDSSGYIPILMESIETELLDIDQQEMDTGRATTDISPSGAPMNPYPWRLLPPLRDPSTTLRATADTQNPSVDRNAPLAQFCEAVYERLNQTECISTRSTDSETPYSTFLHSRNEIMGAVAALYDLCERKQIEVPSENYQLAFPSVPSLRSLLRFLLTTEFGSHRIAMLLTITDSREAEDAFSDAQRDRLSSWGELLSVTLHIDQLDHSAHSISTTKELARILFNGTAALIETAADDDGVDEIIEEFPLEGVCLLPCQQEDDSDQSVLVSIEAHRGGRDSGKQRVVRWIDRQQSDIELPTPPTSSTFYMYLLDEDVVTQTESVLRAAGQSWGIGIAESRPDYFRALIESLASEGIVKRSDLKFLLKFFHQLNRSDSDDLTASEGSIHDPKYIQTFVTDEDRRPDFRPRLQIRNARLYPTFHSGDDPTPLKNLYLSRAWRALRDDEFEPKSITANGEVQPDSEEDGDSLQLESHLDQAVTAPIPNLPKSANESGSSSTLSKHLAELMTVLGAGALPGLEILPMYDEAGPSEPTNSSWNPHKWKVETEKVINLQTVLKAHADKHSIGADETGSGDYLDWISSPDFEPNASASHSDHCDVQYARGRRADLDDVSAFETLDVAVASWVWFDESDIIDKLGVNAIAELLSDHGDDLTASILGTGWMCTDNHGLKFWQQTIPTFLNWQFRHSTLWSDASWFTEKDWWSKGGDSLAWALVDQDSRATRLFPTVDVDEAPASHDVWERLGVKALSALNPTEAAYRLQKLQVELANGSLADTGSTQLQGDRTRQGTGWKTAYTRLLDPIVDYLNASDATLDQLPYLRHLPVLDRQGRWVSVPIKELTGNTEYFEGRHQRSWEQRTATDKWLLAWPSQGELKPLATALDATPRAQTKPIVPTEAVEGEPNPALTNALRDTESVLLAIAAREKDQLTQDDAEALRDDLRYAIDYLKPADTDAFESTTLPGRGRSAVYQTTDNREALVYDQDAADDPTNLASGLCLLFEQEHNLYFRTALDPNSEVDILADDIPLERVRALLDQATVEQLQQDIKSIGVLLETLDGKPNLPSRDDLNEFTGSNSPRDILIDMIATEELDEKADSASSLGQFVKSVHEELTSQQQKIIITALQRDGPTLRKQLLELDDNRQDIISWAVEQVGRILPPPIDPDPCRRLDALASAHTEATTDTINTRETVADWVAAADSHLEQDLDWNATPEAYKLPIESDETEVWLDYDEERFTDLRDQILSMLVNSPEKPLVDGLRRYIEHGIRPDQENSEATRTAVAKRRVQEVFTQIEPETFWDGDESIEPTYNGGIQKRGDSGGGGAVQSHTGRAEFAEQFVLAGVRSYLAEWAKSNDDPTETFWTALDEMRQSDLSIRWHTKSRWKELEKYKEQYSDLIFTGSWTSSDSSNVLDQVLDVTSEQGPGYDILDLTGKLAVSSSNAATLTPHPIEVKAVTGSPPYRFRFTVNEFRRALAFVTAESESAEDNSDRYNPGAYTVLLVKVPPVDSIEDDNTSAELADTEIIRPITLDSKEQLFGWLPDIDHSMRTSVDETSPQSQLVAEAIADMVKGGYVTVEIE